MVDSGSDRKFLVSLREVFLKQLLLIQLYSELVGFAVWMGVIAAKLLQID